MFTAWASEMNLNYASANLKVAVTVCPLTWAYIVWHGNKIDAAARPVVVAVECHCNANKTGVTRKRLQN